MTAIIVACSIVLALGYALRSGRRRARRSLDRPYNNRYNDASGAREDHVG